MRHRPTGNRRPSERKLMMGAPLGRAGGKPHRNSANSVVPCSSRRITGALSVGQMSSRGSRLGAAFGHLTGMRFWLKAGDNHYTECGWRSRCTCSIPKRPRYPANMTNARSTEGAMSEEVSVLFEIMQTTRSMRRLRPDPVPAALIRKILDAGVCAPSGGTCSAGASSSSVTRKSRRR